MKYPIGIQNFGEVRRDGYAYVDKTALMYKLVSEGKYYFLSRPRRFGKSLFLSTLEAYFDGQKELFEGLAVSRLETEWLRHPILHLDLNTRKYDRKEALLDELNRHLEEWEKAYGDEFRDRAPEERFLQVIKKAFEKTGRRVVVLVDEYDKPLLQAIGNDALQTEYRNTLKAFYGALKSCDRYIRFAFLTGVTKFGKVSVFSDLNNLFDISFDQRYSTICGITEAELHANFDEGVQLLAEYNKMTKEECYARMECDFDGYHFCMDSPGMYNPFSVLNTLASQQFRDYWFETGTPSFLVYQLKKTGYPLTAMTEEELSTDTLNSIDIMDENPLPLLYQSGYFYTPKVQERSAFSIARFVKDVRNGDVEVFMRRLENFFANGDYQVMGNLEIYFQNTLYVFFRLMGFYVDVERHTSDGRMDIVMQTPEYVYILELKMDKTADEALAQIEAKGYAKPFAGDSRRIFKIGINFSTATRRIDDWKIDLRL